MQKFVKFIVTGFYIGTSPICPGTFGSLLAFPLCLGLLKLCATFNIKISIPALPQAQQELLGIVVVFVFACASIFIIGKYLTDIYIRAVRREDPKEVVIDEIAGQMLTIILSCFCYIFAHNSHLVETLSYGMIDFIFLFLLPFGFFRLFDICKPWPINWLDQNIKGGFGVMLDDFVAGFFASVMCYAFTFIIIGKY